MKLQGFPLEEAQKELKRIQSLSHDEFENFIEQKKWEQVYFHYKNSPLYKKILGNKLPEIWEDLPIITKREIQKPLQETLSKGYNLKNVFRNNTSGSSGTPFFFAKDKFAHAQTWVIILDRYSRHGIEYGKSLQARFYGIPLSGKKKYFELLKDKISARVRFPIFNLTDEKLNQFIEVFKVKKFEYINGYTSSLVFFANYCIDKKINLKCICPTLKVTFPTSEMCSDSDKEILKKGFGIPVANEYGCAEVDVLAMEDENFSWILSNENVFFEIVDDHGNAVENGKEGKLLITSLHNKAMPFIRYEVGDMGIISKIKYGNYQILEKLIGRTNEFAVLPNGRQVPALTFYYITKTLIQEKYKIKEFIIKQLDYDLFHYEYVSDFELTDDLKQDIQNAMDQYLEPNLKATFAKKDFIERTKAGKLKQFYNLIPKNS